MSIRWIRPAAKHAGKLSRRQFVTAAGASLLLACRARPQTVEPVAPDASRAPELTGSEPRAWLSADAWAMVAAITERILPSDDGPGAKEANVVRFIDRQLATSALKPLGEAMKQFVASVQDWEKRHGTPFCRLDAAAQDQALTALAAGKLDLDFDSQAELFEFLHSLTLEGFLSDPAYGGNRDGVGWAYIAFAPAAMNHVHQGAN
jgi:gluconate 2-dehydrogenase gamma chain